MRRSAVRLTWLLALTLSVALAAPPPAPAATVLIPCAEADLRTAIDAAQTNDIIQIPLGCTIPLTGTIDEDNNVGGDLDIRGNTAATTLTIEGAGPLTTVIDGGAIDRVFDIGPGKTVTISHLTIRNGDATTSAVVKSGGGLIVEGPATNVTLEHVAVTGNKADTGGGIFDNNAFITVRRSTISNNTTTTGGGGGIYFDVSQDVVENSTISDNTSVGAGGGINHNAGPLTITNSTIANNTVTAALGEGGNLFQQGSTTMTNTILAGGTVPDMANHGPDCFPGINSATNSLIQDASNCTITTSTNNQLTQPAALGPLQNNGGGTLTRMPGAGSLAIENGAAAPDCLATDQRGRPRPAGTNCDIGAVETRGPIFADVPETSIFWAWVEDLATAGVTAGCSATDYCPTDPVTREQMAVFLVKGASGSSFTPPPCTAPGPFPDVPCSSLFAPWVQELVARGVTAGCGGGNYCPADPVTREQMAVFLLKARLGSAHTPPACTAPGPFPDVPCSSLFAPWVQELVQFTITAGCGGGNYCPTNPVTREQMAVFLVRTFDLPD